MAMGRLRMRNEYAGAEVGAMTRFHGCRQACRGI